MPLMYHVEPSMLLMSCINQILMPLFTNKASIVFIDFELKIPFPATLYSLDREEIHFSLQEPDMYVLDVRKRKLNDTLTYLEKRMVFNPRATFVIITGRMEADVYAVLREFFIHTTMILEIVAIDHIRSHSHSSFGKNGNSLNFNISVQDVRCQGGQLKNLRTRKLEKQEKVPIVKVGASCNVPSIILTDGVPKSGVDMDILDIISKKLNFKAEVTLVEEFSGTKNNDDFSFDGAFGCLQRKEVDLVIGGVYPTSDGSISFDYTQATSANRYAWIVPAAKVRPFWKRLIFTFSLTVWMMFFTTSIVILLLLSLINRFIMKGKLNWDIELLKLYSMCFISVAVKSSEPRSKKTIYTSWYLFLLIFLNYFTAKLLSNLMVKKFEHQIHNLDELTDVDWKICIFSDLDSETIQHTQSNMMSCTNCATCTNKTAYEGNVVSIRSEKLTLYEMGKFYTNKEREPLVFILDQYYLVTYDVMAFRKNHPLFSKFNKVLGYLKESGVYDRIIKKYSSAEVDRNQKNTSWIALKLQTLAFIFEFMMYGLILSFLIFVSEVFVDKIFRNKNFHF